MIAQPPHRLVAVLGYSTRRGGSELHPICRARLDHAAFVAGEHDAIVLTGGRERGIGRPEADAMLDRWRGPREKVVLEREALSTAENAAHVREIALALGAREVVVVTSRWHAPRAAALFRRALRGTGIGVVGSPAPGPWSAALLAREAACVAALPVQARRAGRYAVSAGSGSKRSLPVSDGTRVG